MTAQTDKSYLGKVDDLTAVLDKLRPGTGGAINFLLRDAYEEGRKAAELGDGEPSPSPLQGHWFVTQRVVKKAVQWNGSNVDEIAEFTGEQAMVKMEGERDALVIQTLEGLMVADIGDWIIRGVNGEFYPCKPDIFAKTYEPFESGAAQEVSPSANFVSEIRPRPDDPSCHVCGAQMAVKEWKCLSCKATTGAQEVSPPSPETVCVFTHNPVGTDTWAAGYVCPCGSCQKWLRSQQFAGKEGMPELDIPNAAATSEARNLLPRNSQSAREFLLTRRGFSGRETIVTSLDKLCADLDAYAEMRGDTRELKAALHKLRPFAYKAESVDCYRCRECHAQSSELSKIVHDADCEVGEVERMLGDEGL